MRWTTRPFSQECGPPLTPLPAYIESCIPTHQGSQCERDRRVSAPDGRHPPHPVEPKEQSACRHQPRLRSHTCVQAMSDSRSRLPLVVAGAAAAAAAAAFVIYTRRCQAPASSAADAPPVAAHAPSQASSSGTPALPPTKDSASGAPPSAPTVSKEQQEEAQRAKERGNKRFQGKQYQLAITEYTNAIGLLKDANDPAVAIFYGNRAQCNACLDQHEAAEADCTAALCIDPKYVKALVRRATAREKLGKAEQVRLLVENDLAPATAKRRRGRSAPVRRACGRPSCALRSCFTLWLRVVCAPACRPMLHIVCLRSCASFAGGGAGDGRLYGCASALRHAT